MDALFGYIQFLGAALVMLAVSIAYYMRTSPDTSTLRRLLSASHGVAGATVYLAALCVWALGKSRPGYGTTYAASFLMPILLVLVSFFLFRGPRSTHWLQLLNLPAMTWAFFVGSMAITGDWL